jgi:alkylation response protein AidB-like acyl-CoA dehydrogenase
VVNGQKVWTSGAQNSDWGILLARTDPDQPKHRGITYFLVDMRSPGIEIRPLRQMTGGAHFNEVFLTDVRIPSENVLGDVNGGWGVAMTTLANERVLIGGGGTGPGFKDLVELARQFGRDTDPLVRQGLADTYARYEIIRYLGMRVRTATSKGQTPGAEASVMKLFYAAYVKDLGDLAVGMQGPAGQLVFPDAATDGVFQQKFFNAVQSSIGGGTDQIQRNIIGERVLGLPREPR